ncbi:hypothetical protein [Aeromicrobium sp. UC242_57]|uniref:hypothetical protein n=1 Tax=Aeromicrobium sp. UC242_57 TaxID=3374624 RepID=UPI0037A02101
MLHADKLLALASVHRVAPRQAPTVPTPPAPAPAPAPTPTHTAPAPPVVPLTQSIPFYPAQAPAPKPAKASTERSWSVGTILLVLGAFGLIVAGLIFVTRSWDNLGLTGRTVILGGVTALIGVLGVWVTRRPLRASAEAVWTVFLALLTLDFFAARHENLLGLEALSIQVTWIVSGAVLLALCVLIAVWARPLVHAALVAPAVIGGLAIAIGGIGAGGVPEDVDFAWRAFIALIVSGLLALSTRPARLAPMTLVARIVFAGFFVAAYVSAFVEVAAHPSLSALIGDAHGVVMALMAVASIVVAWLVPLVRIPLTACGVAAMSLLLVAPLSADGPTGTIWPTVGVLAAGLAAAGSRGRNDWMRGVRVGAALLLAFAAYLVLYLVSNLLATIGQSLDEPWSLAWDARLDAPGMPNIAVWAVSVLLAAFVVSVWFVSRWPELDRFRSLTPLVMASAIGLAAVVGVTGVRLPVLVAAIVLLAVAVTVLGLRIRRLFVTIGPVALVVVVVASLLALTSHGVSAATWMPAAAIVAGLACTDRQAWWRPVYGVAVAVLVPLGVLAVVELFDPDTSITALAVLVAALGLVVVAGLLLVGDTVRLPVEVTSALAVAAALFAAGSTGEVAVRWTVAGVVAIALASACPTAAGTCGRACRHWWWRTSC